MDKYCTREKTEMIINPRPHTCKAMKYNYNKQVIYIIGYVEVYKNKNVYRTCNIIVVNIVTFINIILNINIPIYYIYYTICYGIVVLYYRYLH